MKCAILIPEWHVGEIFLTAFTRSMESYQEPSGPLYVAASLLAAGHEVVFVDGALRSNSEIIARMHDAKPDFVGIYVCAPLWPSAKGLLQGVRAMLPRATTAVGGPWPGAAARQCLEESPDLDLCFTCEGEEISVEVVRALEEQGDLSTIPGLVLRKGREIVDTGYRPPPQDLDSLPFPARELLGPDIERCTLPPGGYRGTPVAHLIGSRGCTNRCIYCFHMEREAHIRYRSADDILDEVEECVNRFGFREVRFLDDNFTGDRERVFELCDGFEQRGIEVPWYVSSRVDTVDPEMLRRMKQAGCWAMLYGAESGVQKNLDTIRKRTTVEQLRQVVGWTKAAGIKMFLPFMFGIPGETFEDGLKTIDLAVELDPYYANFNSLAPFPGTWLWTHGAELGTMNADPSTMTFQGVGFVPNTMTEEEIIRLRQIAFRRFYTRPRFVAKWLMGMRHRSDLLAVAKGAVSMVTLWTSRDAFKKPHHD